MFEADLAAFCGAKHVVTCANGTDALALPLMAWGIGPGDAVFVPVLHLRRHRRGRRLVGATPVFVDVLPDTFNMDPAQPRGAASPRPSSSGSKPAGVIPVDLFGQPADYDAIEPIAGAQGCG